MRAFVVAIGILAVIGLMMSILALGKALAGPDTGGAEVTTTMAMEETAVTLTEFSIAPPELAVSPDGTLTVTNTGTVDHDLTIADTGFTTGTLLPGATGRLDLSGLAPGSYRIFCSVVGHEAAGMTGTIQIGEGGMDHGGTEVDWEAMQENMRASVAAFPAETEGVGNQLFAPTMLPGGVKEFVLVADEIQWEVEPGRFVEGIAYNGQIPGPTIQVNVGDRVRIVVENHLDEITSWHPHGVRQHPNEADGVGFITQDPIPPGGTWSVEFTVNEASVGMYHGHDMGIHQVPNGLVGAFLVGEMPIPEGFDVVDEQVMMLNDAGNIGFSLNGKSFPATAPYVLQQGESMLVHYMNEGLMPHPMHLHNNRQLVIAKDGFPLESPYYVDTLNVAPGERYSVLVLAELPGVWVWHCHILSHVEKSDGTMFGMLTALIVEE